MRFRERGLRIAVRGGALLAALAVVLTQSACYQRSLVTIPTPTLADTVLVRSGSREVTLHHPAVEGDSLLTGWAFGAEAGPGVAAGDSSFVAFRLPLMVLVRDLDAPRTALAVVGGVAVALTVAFLAVLSSIAS